MPATLNPLRQHTPLTIKGAPAATNRRPLPKNFAQRAQSMMTSLVDIEDARSRLAAGEQPYAFEFSDHLTIVGPACGYGADYLTHLRTQGRYSESLEDATQIALEGGATITGVWFVKQPPKPGSIDPITTEDR